MNFNNCTFTFKIDIQNQQLPNLNTQTNTQALPTTLPSLVNNSSIGDFFQNLISTPVNSSAPPIIRIEDDSPKDNPTNQSITQLASPILVEEFSPTIGDSNQTTQQTASIDSVSSPVSNLNTEDLFTFEENPWTPGEDLILDRIDHSKGIDYINFQLAEAAKIFNRPFIDCQIRRYEHLLDEVQEFLIKFPNDKELQYAEKKYIEIIDLKKQEKESLYQNEIDKISSDLVQDLWRKEEDDLIESTFSSGEDNPSLRFEEISNLLNRPLIDCQIRYAQLFLKKTNDLIARFPNDPSLPQTQRRFTEMLNFLQNVQVERESDHLNWTPSEDAALQEISAWNSGSYFFYYMSLKANALNRSHIDCLIRYYELLQTELRKTPSVYSFQIYESCSQLLVSCRYYKQLAEKIDEHYRRSLNP